MRSTSLNLIPKQQPGWFATSLHATGLGVTALTLCGFYSLVYQPLLEKQDAHGSRAEQLSRLQTSQGTETNEFIQLREQLETMQQSVSDLHRQLSKDHSEESLLADIQAIAADSDLQVIKHQFGERQNFSTHAITYVEFQCAGSYDSICRFLQQAEQITKTAKLSNLELQSANNSQSYPIQLTFVLYSEGESNDTRERREVL